ncbi:MAG TPA: helicase-related protein, partial [Candidatus Hodarchaeales archaeon]|nr:helicase-related protein [Candidatus Hodarchaeales archaeon]
MPLKEGILKGVNVPPLFQLFEAQLDDQTLKVEQGDYEKKTLAAALREAEIHKAIPEIYERMIPKDQRKKYPTLVFVPSVNLVHDVVQTMTERFAAEGVNIKGWSGERTTTKSMQEDLDAYNKGEIDVLVLCEMGGRGINLPRARCLIDAYPTMSPTKLEQRHGRVLRTIRKDSELGREGFLKRFAYVAQVVPKSNRFRPFLLPDLLDCWDDFKQGRILGVQKSHRGQAGDTHEGRSIASEIDELRTHFEEQKPLHRVTLIKQIDVYEQLKLRENLPQADAEGFFTLSTGEGEQMSVERFGTAAAWSKEFKTTPITVRKTLANLTGITGKDARGKIHKEIFFAESVVRQACADFLKQIPQADEKGFFTMVNTEIEPN